ncbi:MAG: hypothetical protein ACTHQ3_07675 [Motilibacteraceae bacterium]
MTGVVRPAFVKRRERAEPGSIPDVLQMFASEVRLYREIAPHVGVRVPVCYRAGEVGGATLLELEDVSPWPPGADPPAAAEVLAGLHRRWAGWRQPVGRGCARPVPPPT